MEYAVIETGGKQYKVNVGSVLELDRLVHSNDSISFDKVLLYVNGEEMSLGKPYVEGLSVTAKVIEDIKGDKIRVARFTAKSRHRKVRGFRAFLTKVQIEKISKGKGSSTVVKIAVVKKQHAVSKSAKAKK